MATLTAFISYSHLDEHALERFSKHHSVLRRDGIISEWHDQKISAGGDIDSEISKLLETCDLFIPLVSPDFLASSYCHDREMVRALERHKKGELRVVPIIIEPCDWQNSPLGRLKVLPKDGTPVSNWTNQNTAWLDVVQKLRLLADELGTQEPTQRLPSQGNPSTSPRYRAKRDFDEVDKMEFRDQAFMIIRDYFSNASAEIGGVDDIKSKYANMGDDAFTCTVVNRARKRAIAHITVHTRTSRMSVGDISYSFSERAEPGTANGWMQIESDEYQLYLKLHDMSFGNNEKEKLTPKQAAERLWEMFLENAEIAYG